MSLLTLNTSTDIANAALAQLKHGRRFTDLATATGDAAEHARQFYQLALDETTMARRWKFAESTVRFAAPNITPTFAPEPYTYSFNLPPELLRVREVYPRDAEHYPWNCIGYDKRGNILFATVDAIDVVFTGRLTTLAVASPLFIQAVVLRLAYHLAIPIANNPRLKDAMMTAYLAGVSAAFAAEDDVPHPQTVQLPSGIAARRG